MTDLHLFVPNLYETEIDEMIGSRGKTIPNFQEATINSSTSSAQFVFDKTSFIKIFSSINGQSVTNLTENTVQAKIPSKEVVNSNGTISIVTEQHPYVNAEGKPENHLFRHVPFFSVLGTDTLPAIGRVLDIGFIYLPSHWIRVSGTSIIQFSPTLESSILKWKAANPGKILSNKDFFGDTPYAYPIDNTHSWYTDGVEVDLINKTISGGNSTTGIYLLGVKEDHPTIANMVLVSNSLHTGRALIKDRGLNEYGQPDTTNPAPVVNAAVTNVTTDFIQGTSSQINWYVTLYEGSLGLQATLKTNPFDGGWIYRFTPDEKAYFAANNIDITTYKDSIKVLLHQQLDPGYSVIEAAKQDPNVVMVSGLPSHVLLKDNYFIKNISTDAGNAVSLNKVAYVNLRTFEKYNNIFFKYTKDFYADKSPVDEILKTLKNSSAIQEEVNKVFAGLYYGASNLDDNKILLSAPNSVVKYMSIDLFVNVTERSHDVQTNMSTILEDNFFTTYRHFLTLGGSTTGFINDKIEIRSGWSLDSVITSADRYLFKWTRNQPDDADIYSLKWTANYEPRAYTDQYSIKWSKEAVDIYEDEYLLRWNLELPDDDEDRLFFDLSWSKEEVITTAETYNLSFSKEMVKTFKNNYSLKWTKPLLEEVLIKLFYIKENSRHHISYMVYGSPSVQDYIQNNTLTFYFSNPSKYELVKFNYNSEPYLNIFIKNFKDDSLNALSGIPFDYTLIGNYTILDIDPKNSLSLDIVTENKQLNEFRSYWLPENLSELDTLLVPMANGMYAAPIEPMFRDDHHVDIVELEVEFINDTECCFTQKSVGTRCSPY